MSQVAITDYDDYMDDRESSISKDILIQSVGKKGRKLITDELVETVNRITDADGDMFTDAYRENFISYLSIMKDGEFSIKKYVMAVKYCSHKLLGESNIDSYMYTFPKRYNRLMDIHKARGMKVADIRQRILPAYVKAYNRNKLVNKVMEQTLIPSKVLNAPYYQQALNVNVDLMMHAKSEMVRMQAADSVMRETKNDGDGIIKIDMSIKQNDAVADLMESLGVMATKAKGHIQSGNATLKELGAMKVKTEFTDVDVVEGDVDE